MLVSLFCNYREFVSVSFSINQFEQIATLGFFPVTNESSTRPNLGSSIQYDNQEGFSGCLLLKDDNHYLIEWLAYHYHRLPLKRLIVAVDPTSRTSPTSILNRYHELGLMNITEWTDRDFWVGEDLEPWKKLEEGKATNQWIGIHRDRQKMFYLGCMTRLKEENASWTALFDVDEYITANQNVKEKYRLPLAEKKTIFDSLEYAKAANISSMLSSPCIGVRRLMFGSKESTSRSVQKNVPEGFNGSDFFTLRWRHHKRLGHLKENGLAKSMLDLSRVNFENLTLPEMNPHRVVRCVCPKTNIYIENGDSSFLLNHYIGTWKQWSFRSDPRKDKGNTRTRKRFDLNIESAGEADSARDWLGTFVEKEGRELAAALLEGAGDVVENHD